MITGNLCSLDVSSINVGYSEFLIDSEKKTYLLDITNFHLDNELPIYKRFEAFEAHITSKKFETVFMEDRLKSFFPGQTNKNAILAIAAANEIVSFIMNKKTTNIQKLHPNSWRKLVGLTKIDKSLNIKDLVIQKTIESQIFTNYLIANNKALEEVFPTKIISRGENKGKKVYVTGVNDQADSFLLGIAGIVKFS